MRLEPGTLSAAPLDRVEALRLTYGGARAEDVLAGVLAEFPGEVALVSSFGAEAAVLLKMVADIDRDLPVLMIDLLMLFEETLDYQRVALGASRLAQRPPPAARGARFRAPRSAGDAAPARHRCLLRHSQGSATRTGARGSSPSRSPAASASRPRPGPRSQVFEADGDRLKVNPLAHWSAADLRAYMDAHELPRHPLVARGYPSIGCAPCTTRVAPNENDRAGRWRGSDKVECGIHFGADGRILREAS